MEILEHLALGLETALSAESLLVCLGGVLLGTLIGVLPGIGPLSAIALLLPFTFALDAGPALIMLAGIYYGSQSGGSTTAILLNLPGEASSAVTCLDGHAMARQGRAGAALAVAALGSVFAGLVATGVVALLSGPLAAFATSFEAADYVGVLVFGLVAAVALAHGSVQKAVAMILLGLLLGTVGTEVATGQQRFTLGLRSLADGVGLVPLTIGLFGLAEIIHSLSTGVGARRRLPVVGSLWPSRAELRQSFGPILRGTAVGSAVGVLPGGGPVIASLAAYAIEKRVAAEPSRFGRGAIEGIAAPEAANNAAAQTSFIPLLTLGLPSNPVMALFIGAMLVHGVQPGPGIVTRQPELFWGLVVSMLIGNLLLVVVNLPLVGLWVRLLRIPYRLLFPATIVLSCVGIYSLSHNTFDLAVAAVFGVLGYFLRVLQFEPAPLLLGFVLSRPLEENLQRALVFADGNPATFLTHPVGAALLGLSALLMVSTLLPGVARLRRPAGVNGEHPGGGSLVR